MPPNLVTIATSLALLIIPAYGQTLSILHNFTNTPDGALPAGGLILSGGAFYGTTQEGGASGTGTIFRINGDGTGLTNLHSFSALTYIPLTPPYNNDGAFPSLVLALSSNTLYGASFEGGANANGTIFSINTDGSDFSVMYTFSASSNSGGNRTNSDGAAPASNLLLSGNTLYGTASGGGTLAHGTIFAISTGGVDFTNLYTFTGGTGGNNPQGGLVLSGTTLYGTTLQGGLHTWGMVFAVQTNGLGFKDLYDFTGQSDGGFPQGALVLSGTTLYGIANSAGNPNGGAIYGLQTDGSAFKNLHVLNINTDGSSLECALMLSGGLLYGTAVNGGSANNGTVFCIGTNGGFTNLHSFTATSGSQHTNTDGAQPISTLLYASNSLYGLANMGGTNGYGTLFRLMLPGPALGISATPGANAILTWPTNSTGFTLQSTVNLQSPNWSAVSLAPAVVNGQYTVPISTSDPPRFYRLSY